MFCGGLREVVGMVKDNMELTKKGETAAKRTEAGKMKMVARVRERRGEARRWKRNFIFIFYDLDFFGIQFESYFFGGTVEAQD